MKRISRLVAFALVFAMLLPVVAAAAPVTAQEVSEEQVERLGGDDRYATSVKISEAAYEKSNTVILANGMKFPDALAGGPLAAQYGAPILLVEQDNVPEAVLNEIERLGATKVLLLGGPAAISEDVKAQLAGYDVDRAEGLDRYETAVEIGKLVVAESNSKTAMLVVDNNYADALSASSPAGLAGNPILFTGTDSLNEKTEKALSDWGIENVNIIGGPAAISQAVVDELEDLDYNVERYYGDDRYATALDVARLFENPETVVLASAKGDFGFADALAGGALAARYGAPLLLTWDSELNPSVLEYIENNPTSKVYVLGGENAVNKEVFDAVEEALEEVEVELEVVSVSAINSNQAEVEFNMAVKEVKTGNFKVTDKDGNLVFVSKAELNEAKTVATLTFVNKFADKGIYNVEVSNVADVEGNIIETAIEAFSYQAAEVKTVEFTKTTVGQKADLNKVVKIIDELGRDVTKEHTVEFETSDETVIGKDGKALEKDGSAIVVAKVKVGDSYVKSAPTTITVKEAAAAKFVGSYVYTGEAATDIEAFNELKEEDKIDYVYKSDKGSKLALYYEDQYGEDAGNVTSFNEDNEAKLENLTPAVVIVDNTGKINPMSVGEGYVKVTNGDIVTTVKITVRENQKVATMEVEKTEISVVAGNSETIEVTFKDQYGNKTTQRPTVKSNDTKVALVEAVNNGVVVTGIKEGAAKIDVSFKVGEETLEDTITVEVVKAGDLATYEVKAGATKLDNNGNNDDKDKLPTSTDIVVNKIDTNGNNIGTADAKLKEVDKNGKAVEAGKALLNIAANNKTVTAGEKAGTAYVEVSVGTLVVGTVEIEVVNTKSTPSTVKFDGDALQYVAEYSKDGTITFKLVGSDDAHNDLKEDLKSIIEIKDQYGVIMEDTEYTVKEVKTNLNGLTLSSEKLDTVTKERATLDIVISEINVDEDNLLEEVKTIKVVVDAKQALKDQAEAALVAASDNRKFEGSATDFMTLENVTVAKGVATADFTNGDSNAVYTAIKAIYTKLETDGKIKDDKVEGTGGPKDAKEYAIDSYVMNTLARYLGSLETNKNKNSPVTKIVFDDVEYTQDGKERKGSNWFSASGKSLVSAIVDEQKTVVRDVTFTIVDKDGYSIDINFVAISVPTAYEVWTK